MGDDYKQDSVAAKTAAIIHLSDSTRKLTERAAQENIKSSVFLFGLAPAQVYLAL